MTQWNDDVWMRAAGPDRRSFLRLAAAAGVGSVLAGPRWFPLVEATGTTEALVLTCMDYRLLDHVRVYMNHRKLKGKYDHIVLAGAALGAITDKYPDWNQSFWEHLDLAIKLHGIHSVIVIDHRDCGAYKLILGEQSVASPAAERNAHAAQLAQLKKLIGQKHAELKVETLLMALDGKVEAIAA